MNALLDNTMLGLFVVASIGMLLSPGPAVLFIVARSLQQGRIAGIVSMLGVTSGGAVHVIAATLGISALISSSAVAFRTVKYAGAAYLIYLGIKRLRQPVSRAKTNQEIAPERLSRIWFDGFIVNILNPKTTLFFIAFIPQFTDPSRGNVALQFLLLGTIFLLLGIVSDGCYALAAAQFKDWFSRGREWLHRRIPAAIYIGLGVLTAAGDFRKD